MSSQGGDGTGLNPIMCYFPWFPYYKRYQIGFNIRVNPTDAPRLIHVLLYFPDGFFCNPADFSGISDPPSFSGSVPHFMSPNPQNLHPLMYHSYTHAPSHFCQHVPMGFQEHMMWEAPYNARVMAYVINGQPGEFMVIDDVRYDAVPQCEECNEFHRDLEGHSHRQPSTSGTSGQNGTTHAAPRTASERVATDHKGQLKKEDNFNFTQKTADELQHVSDEGIQGIQRKNDTTTPVCDMPSTATITEDLSSLDIGEGQLKKEDNSNFTQKTADELQYVSDEGIQGIQRKNDTTTLVSDMPSTASITKDMSSLDIGEGQLKKEDNSNFTQKTADELQHVSDEGIQGIQRKNDTTTPVSDMPSTATITEDLSSLDIGEGQLKKEDNSNFTQKTADELQHGSDEGMQGKQGNSDTATPVSNISSAATVTQEVCRFYMGGRNLAQDNQNVNADPKDNSDN